jgi:hypothetical protein
MISSLASLLFCRARLPLPAAILALALLLAGCAGHRHAVVSPPSAAPPPAPPPAPSPAPSPARVSPSDFEPPPPLAPGEVLLFDGKTLKGWRASDFGGKGEVSVTDGRILLGMGYMTGITWTGDLPRMNYEVSLEAMRVEGSDFFCGLTFPVGADPCSFIVGGWGGGVVGLSSLDGDDASQNETTQYLNFQNRRWYEIRLRVVPNRIQAWIDEEKVVDVDISKRKLSIRIEVEPSLPLGIATWNTAAALRHIRLKRW